MKHERQDTSLSMSSAPTRTPTAAILSLLLAFVSACASEPTPLGPDEVGYSTHGYSYRYSREREKLEANWSNLKAGMKAAQVFELLGLERALPMIEVVDKSEMIDIAYGGNLLKFRDGKLTEFSRNAAPNSNFDRYIRLKRK